MMAATSITVRVPLKIRRRPGRKTVVTAVPAASANDAVPTCADPTLVKALARAFRYQRLLDEGPHASVSDIAAAERIDRGYLGRILQLTLLAPELVEGVLDGSISPGDGLRSILRAAPLPWDQQRQLFSSPPRKPLMQASGRAAAQSLPDLEVCPSSNKPG